MWAVSLGFSVQAQDIDTGLKASVNFAQLSGNATNGLDGRNGFHVVGIISFELIDYLAIQGETNGDESELNAEGLDFSVVADAQNRTPRESWFKCVIP